VDFIITKNAVVTSHYEPFEFFKELKNLEASDSLQLLYTLLGGFFRFEERQLRHVREKVELVSNQLFKDREKEILSKISRLKRDISEFRLIVRSEEGILNSLRERGVAFWGEGARVYLNDLAGDHLRVVNQIEDYRQTVLDFENTNTQILNAKATEAMKRFAAMSFLTFPFVLFVAIADLHVPGNPLSQMQNAFWLTLSLVIAGVLCLATYFKSKDWL
jgi:Mg2+ and Co2+ transporter CorA